MAVVCDRRTPREGCRDPASTGGFSGCRRVSDVTLTSGLVSTFIDHHFRHFNAAVLKDAANAYARHLDNGGQMLVTLAGAMSTAELGLSLAEMIRHGKVHAISCTGALDEASRTARPTRRGRGGLPGRRRVVGQQNVDHANISSTCRLDRVNRFVTVRCRGQV